MLEENQGDRARSDFSSKCIRDLAEVEDYHSYDIKVLLSQSFQKLAPHKP